MTKRVYKREKYDLGDGAIVYRIQNFTTNSDDLLNELINKIPWRHFEYTVYDKKVMSPRLMNIVDLTTLDNNFLPELAKTTRRVSRLTGVNFSYAVLNYYRDGNDYISYHSDREVGAEEIVVSVTVGDTRRFILKHKFRDDVKYTFMLNHGDVLILNYDAIKGVYKHSVPKMKNVGSRVNITFRQ